MWRHLLICIAATHASSPYAPCLSESRQQSPVQRASRGIKSWLLSVVGGPIKLASVSSSSSHVLMTHMMRIILDDYLGYEVRVVESDGVFGGELKMQCTAICRR